MKAILKNFNHLNIFVENKRLMIVSIKIFKENYIKISI